MNYLKVNPLFPYCLKLGEIKIGLDAISINIELPAAYDRPFTFLSEPEEKHGSYWAMIEYKDGQDKDYELLSNLGICPEDGDDWEKSIFAVSIENAGPARLWIKENRGKINAYIKTINEPDKRIDFSE